MAVLVERSRCPSFLRLQVLDHLAGDFDVQVLGFIDAVLTHQLAHVEPLIASNPVNCFHLRGRGMSLAVGTIAISVRCGVPVAVRTIAVRWRRILCRHRMMPVAAGQFLIHGLCTSDVGPANVLLELLQIVLKKGTVQLDFDMTGRTPGSTRLTFAVLTTEHDFFQCSVVPCGLLASTMDASF